MNKDEISFAVFFMVWAEFKGWEVPACHIRACEFLEHRGENAVFQAFRGFAKSTLIAVYNAWRYWKDPTYRILHQGDQDPTAYKTSRDTKAVLLRHPLTKGIDPNQIRGDVKFWWVPGADDERNPSMQAAGILSNITSSRADEVQNDDVEVPKNIGSPEMREKLRYRLGDQVHCAVPGAKRLFIGTPHTHDSIYDEEIRKGADVLKIPMFRHEKRIAAGGGQRHKVEFEPDMAFAGIGEFTRRLTPGNDYRYENGHVVFARTPDIDVDFYAGSEWPERFTTAEMLKRRRDTRTVNEWDSQYQLHSKPITEMRLDPDKMRAYEVEPEIKRVNGTVVMTLGKVRIVGMACRWDPSSGKVNSDVSAFAIVLQDASGRRYWHRSVRLSGEVAVFNDDASKIIGGQVLQICDLVREFSIPRVTVETNGIGVFAPTVLKAALKQQKLHCGVGEEPQATNKQKRILESFEGPLNSGMLWAHISVLDGPTYDQMKDFDPSKNDQPDDYIDAGAGAIIETPERIRAEHAQDADASMGEWRPNSGEFEVEVEF